MQKKLVTLPKEMVAAENDGRKTIKVGGPANTADDGPLTTLGQNGPQYKLNNGPTWADK